MNVDVVDNKRASYPHRESNATLLGYVTFSIVITPTKPVMRRLTTGIRSEKCVVTRFSRCANAIKCTYTNLDSIAYYTPRLYGIAYCS